MQLPAAVLWDLDGTLIDSEPDWIAAELELTELYDVDWNEADGKSLVGSALPHAGAVLHEKGVPLSAEEIVSFLLDRVLKSLDGHIPWQPGAVEFLRVLRDAGIPCALVTMSYRSIADIVLATDPGQVFTVSVTGDEVTHGKPDPEAYLTAADMLGVDIETCVIFEDSLTGIAAAEASGARVVGVQHLIEVGPAPQRNRLASLDGLTLDELRQIAGGTMIDRLSS